MGKLREQMKGDLELRGLSSHTRDNYLRHVSQLIIRNSFLAYLQIPHNFPHFPPADTLE
jgi:hypothetical protein